MVVNANKCVLCEGKDLTLICRGVRDNPDRGVLQCKKCSLIFLDDDRTMEEIYCHYQNDYEYHLEDKFKKKDYLNPNIRRVELIKRYLRPETKLLEIGCGDGDFLLRVSSLVQTTVGLELNEALVEHCKNVLSLTVYNTSLEDFHYDGKFDVICLFQTFEHISNPVEFLHEVGKIMHPEGILFVDVPNVNDSLLSLYKVPGFDIFYFRENHIFYYNQYTLKKMLERCDFNVVKTIPIQLYSFTNHLHWLFTNTPQENLEVGFDISLPRMNDKVYHLFKELDAFYKEKLKEIGYTDTLCMVAKKNNKFSRKMV